MPIWADLGGAYAERMSRRMGRIKPNASTWVSKMLENYWHLGQIALALPRARVVHITREPVQARRLAFARLHPRPISMM